MSKISGQFQVSPSASSGCGVTHVAVTQHLACTQKTSGTTSIVLLPFYRSLIVEGKFGFDHEWVLSSVPFALAVSFFGFDCPIGYRTGPGGLVVLILVLIRSLPAMSTKEIQKLMAQHQSGEAFSWASHTMTAQTQCGRRWRPPMSMLTSSNTS